MKRFEIAYISGFIIGAILLGFAFVSINTSVDGELKLNADSIYQIEHIHNGMRTYYSDDVKRDQGFLVFVDKKTGQERVVSGIVSVIKLKNNLR